ncbi:unnamed protein product [Orchesella dallaii]|uniref:ATP synthase F(0) complex subunit e, mitochondrial n=1 Tax=Orchesella dallaii TaxID=48710 RepID=A0ABP1Q0I0_9HEXA
MASSAAMPEPVRVSPLIRVGRWSFLALGIMWGISRNRSLSKKETKFREMEEQARPAREAAKAAEKARLNREEMLYLAKETGTPVPPNF